MPDSPSIRRPSGPRPVPLRVRFERHVERDPSGCWRWTGMIDRSGHPRIRVKGGVAVMDLAAPAHTIGVTRLGTRLVTHSDPTLLTPARAEELLAASYVDGLLSSRTRVVEVVEFDGEAFWWPREREPVRHAWKEGGASHD